MTPWTTFTRRTNAPKLSYLEERLDLLGIPHRLNGHSPHAPILQVPEERLDEAWALLGEQVDMGDDTTARLDDIPDDDVLFSEYAEGEECYSYRLVGGMWTVNSEGEETEA